MEKTSDIQKPSSKISKPSKAKESKVVTSDMRKNKKGDPQQQRANKSEKDVHAKEQQPAAQHQGNVQAEKPERKIVNEDEQKQVVNRPASDASPTEAEDQK